MKKFLPVSKGTSLYTVILCCFLLVVGVLLVSISVTLSPRINALLEQNAVERTRETVSQSTKSLEIYVENMLGSLHFAADLVPKQIDTPTTLSTFQAQIDLLRGSQQGIRNIALFDAAGNLLCGTSSFLRVPTSQVAGMEWFEKALSWQGTVPFFSSPYVQHIFTGHNEWVVSVSKTVEYQQGDVQKIAVLLMDFDFASISAVAGASTLGKSGYLYILDTQNRLIYHPQQQLIYAGLSSEDLSTVIHQVVGICRDIQNNKERVLFINPINQTRWRLVGVAYIDEILALQSTIMRIFTASLLCGGLLSIAIASLTAFYATRPLRMLESKMRQVEQGGLHTTIPTNVGFVEIRSLSITFNHLLAHIRSLMQQVVREQEAKRLHELNALQAQINPHFLYNTLDSIIWMQERGRLEEATEMVSALAKLFRISISKGRNVITVREEIEHVRNYLTIQKMRFRDKFTYEIITDEASLCLCTLKLILQPMAENAVHHAIDIYNDTVLHIRICVQLEENTLIFQVADDGIGIPQHRLHTIMTSESIGKSGIGLRNVHERILLTYGPPYGLTLESQEDEGTTVTIRLPAHPQEDSL